MRGYESNPKAQRFSVIIGFNDLIYGCRNADDCIKFSEEENISIISAPPFLAYGGILPAVNFGIYAKDTEKLFFSIDIVSKYPSLIRTIILALIAGLVITLVSTIIDWKKNR